MISFIHNPAEAKYLNAYTVHLPILTGKDNLLFELSSRICFPLQFGMNWDALNDILSDPYWISEQRVVIVHDEIPKLSQKDLVTYIRVLHSVMSHDEIKGARKHEELDVVFPLEAFDIVKGAIEDVSHRDENK